MPSIQFTWTISIGQVVAIASALLAVKPFLKLYRGWLIFMGEHEAVKYYIRTNLGIKEEDFARVSAVMIEKFKKQGRKPNGRL